MVKRTSSERPVMLVVAVLVVFSLMATSFAVTGLNHDSQRIGSKNGDINYNLLINSSNSNSGYVKYISLTSGEINTYTVKFSESGLLSTSFGVVPWSVTMDGETLWSVSSTITFNVPNGTYHYQISKTASAAGYTPSPQSGNVTVNGLDKSIQIEYTSNGGNAEGYGTGKYNVTISVSNPAAFEGSDNFYVDLFLVNAYHTYYINAPFGGNPYTITGVLNGTYLLYPLAFVYNSGVIAPIQYAGYTQAPEPQVVVVNGSNTAVTMNLTANQALKTNYNVTFTETGLPSGTSWSITFNGTKESSTTSTITFTEPNGTYSYTIGNVSGYTISKSTGSITVSGSNVSQPVTFTAVKTTVTKYTVTFTESGLTSGTSWSVTLNGSTQSSTTSTITFTEPNGTYSYTIGNVSGYTISKSTGSVTVNGNNIPVSIIFSSTSSPPPSKHPSSGISSLELYAIIGAVVAVAAIGSAVFLIRRKK